MDAKTVSYIINELAEERGNYFNSVAPPIIQTSNFAFRSVDDLRKAFEDEYSTFIYSRATNPTVKILSEKLAALDGAEDCLVVNSGAGAIFASVLANVQSGDHIISVDKPYSWAQKMFNNILPRFNVTVTYVDGTKTENFEKAIQHNTTLIYLESPNSWNFALQDLEGVAKIAKGRNIITVCDNSYCTPLYQNPIAYGIDIAVQSATKYLNGHSDVIAGVITASRTMIAKIYFSEFMNMGISTTPFNAWLLIRGLRTLPMRLEKITANTKQVLAFLKNHEKVEQIIFPFDKDFAQYDLAKKQMRGACGLFSFYIKASTIEEIENFCEGLKHILMAVSWGGYESLIIPGCASMKAGEFDPNNKDHRILRMFVGMEDPEYIIEDLQRGFKAM